MKRVKARLPSICVDQHLDRGAAAAFRLHLRTIEVSQSSRFHGRDERDFLPELFSENAIFATSDEAFVDEVLDLGLHHAGIVFIPEAMTPDEKALFAEIAAGYIQGACSESRHAFRSLVIYPAHDGLRAIEGGKDRLEFSWDWLDQIMESS